MLILFGMVLIGAVAIGAALVLSNLRDRALSESEHSLQNIAFVLAEQFDRSLQSIELIQQSVVERMQSLGISSAEDYERQMSGYDTHQRLKDMISALPHLNAIVLTDAQGKLINFSRSWPTPSLKIPDQDPSEAFKSDPHLTSFVGKPLRSPATGNWVVSIARKFAGQNGEYLGAVLGIMELQYFEEMFKAIALTQNSALALFRRDGTLLVRYPYQEIAIGQSFAHSGLFANVLSQSDHGTVRQIGLIDGKERLISGRSLAHYPIIVVVGTTVADALANWEGAAIYTTGATVLIAFVIGCVVFLSAWLIGKKRREQSLRLDTALNNMSQGLLMFDSAERLIVCNERYIQMYGLSPAIVKPGVSLRELLQYRAAIGTFSRDPEQYRLDFLVALAQKKPIRNIFEPKDGRTILVINQPMAGGGWVSTHEDITESKQREASFHLLFKNNPMPMWVYDCGSLRFLAVNQAAVAHYGYSLEQFLSMTVLDIRPVEEHERFLQLMRVAGAGHDGEQIWRHQKSDGTKINVAVYARALSYEGRAASLVTVVDVTARQWAEAELRRTRTFLDTVIENVPATIFVKDARECRYVLINRAGEDFFGVSRDEMIGKNAYEVYQKEYADSVAARDHAALQSDRPLVSHDHPIPTPGNGIRTVTAKKLAIHGDDGEPQYLLTVIEDVTERKRIDAQIAHMAHHDPLTDLANRALLCERLEAAFSHVRRGEQLALLYLDLDHFKNINDSLGHTVGDELLKAVSDRLRGCVRDTDTIARLGGDEFAIVQTTIEQPPDTSALAKRILEAIKAPYDLNGHQIVVDVSIGIAVAPNDGTDPDELLKNADLAMYGAKADGRGTYRFFEPEMNARMKARCELEIDLRKAFVNGQFELYYQPIVNLQRDEISGCEALLRWHHPERGMISPTEFIPIAEDMGLIIPLGEWVLRQACNEAAAWPRDIKIAVNLSPVQLMNQKLFSVVFSALAASGLPAHRLELEITETVLVQEREGALVTLHQLRELGVRIVMDDFGTGYSSLSYLRRFPFDKIKIDRAFVKDLSDKEDALAIVKAVTSLASGLNMTTTAEGVETEQQLEKVRAVGCTEMQGYLFSPPRPAAEISRLFLSRAGVVASAA